MSKASPHKLLALLAGAAALAAATGALRTRAQAVAAPAAAADYDIPPFPADVVRPFSFGLRSVVSDLMFLQAIQVYGGLPKRSQTAAEGRHADRALDRLLTYAVDLDPKFAGAYKFAGNAMPRHTRDHRATNVRQAAVILERGVRERGDDWHIAFTLGFLESFYLGEFVRAGEHMAIAARTPGSPPYVGLLATRLVSEGGNAGTALQMARAMRDEATEEKTREEWQQRVGDLEIEQVLQAIDAASARYRVRTGKLPETLAELVRGGDLPGFPVAQGAEKFHLVPDGTARLGDRPRLQIIGRSEALSGLEVE